MRISIVVAMAKNRVIGKRNRLPWYLPADLKRFKQLTMGKPIIMGRKTRDSLERALPDRVNIVVTRQTDYHPAGTVAVHSVEEAIKYAQSLNAEEVFIIGGEQIYSQTINRADRLYITEIDEDIDGDVFFPEFDRNDWELFEQIEGAVDEKNQYPHRFLVFHRKPRPA